MVPVAPPQPHPKLTNKSNPDCAPMRISMNILAYIGHMIMFSKNSLVCI